MAGPSVIQSFLVGAVAGMTHQRGIYRPRPLIASFTTSTTTRESEWSNGEELSNWGVDRFSSPRLSVCMRDDGADHCHQEVPVYRQEGERLEEEEDVFIHMNDAGWFNHFVKSQEGKTLSITHTQIYITRSAPGKTSNKARAHTHTHAGRGKWVQTNQCLLWFTNPTGTGFEREKDFSFLFFFSCANIFWTNRLSSLWHVQLVLTRFAMFWLSVYFYLIWTVIGCCQPRHFV